MNSNLTQAELAALQSPLSNDCRVLYLLGLRPNANSATTSSAPIDYKQLLNLLNGDGKEEPYQRGRQVNSLVRQLEQVGLVALPLELDLEHVKQIQAPMAYASSNRASSKFGISATLDYF